MRDGEGGVLTALDRGLLAMLRADAAGPVPGEAPWDRLRTRAEELGAAPLLFRRLQGRAGVPDRVRAALRRRYLEAAAESTHRTAQLGRVLDLLRRRDVEALVLKGAHLAEAVYESPALRPMGDVDLLVREADLGRARDALLADGFRQSRLSPFEEVVTGRHHLLPFVRGDERALRIELHFRLTPRHVDMFDADGVWERARQVRIAGVAARALGPEDLLLHLAVHACLQHRLAGSLAPLLDADAVLRVLGPEVAWDALADRARREGAGGSAALLLSLAEELLGAPLPEGVADRLAPAGTAPGLRALALAQIFDDSGGAPFVPLTLARLAHARGLRGTLGVLLRRVSPGRRGRREPAGSARALALPLRVLDLACLLWVFHRPALRLLAGCEAERRSAALGMRGEELALALTAGRQ